MESKLIALLLGSFDVEKFLVGAIALAEAEVEAKTTNAVVSGAEAIVFPALNPAITSWITAEVAKIKASTGV